MPWYFYNNRGVLKQDGLDDLLPIGLITAFVSASPVPTIPTGWLLCNGSVQTTANYQRLAEILAYPAIPGATFTLPNLNTRFPVGASGSYPVKSTGGSATHSHGITSHSHTNSHTHSGMGNHTHSADHQHNIGSGHTHGNTGLTMGASNQNVDAREIAVSASSNPGHSHPINGSTGDPTTNPALVMNNSVVSDPSGAAVSGSENVALPTVTPSLTPLGDTLPPYLNVYYIIKGLDLSGRYI